MQSSFVNWMALTVWRVYSEPHGGKKTKQNRLISPTDLQQWHQRFCAWVNFSFDVIAMAYFICKWSAWANTDDVRIDSCRTSPLPLISQRRAGWNWVRGPRKPDRLGLYMQIGGRERGEPFASHLHGMKCVVRVIAVCPMGGLGGVVDVVHVPWNGSWWQLGGKRHCCFVDDATW